MSVHRIYEDVGTRQIDWSFHAVEQMYRSGMSRNQVYEMILRGTVHKVENDEKSQGQYSKYTIGWRGCIAVVKDCVPAFIITVGRRR